MKTLRATSPNLEWRQVSYVSGDSTAGLGFSGPLAWSSTGGNVLATAANTSVAKSFAIPTVAPDLAHPFVVAEAWMNVLSGEAGFAFAQPTTLRFSSPGGSAPSTDYNEYFPIPEWLWNTWVKVRVERVFNHTTFRIDDNVVYSQPVVGVPSIYASNRFAHAAGTDLFAMQDFVVMSAGLPGGLP